MGRFRGTVAVAGINLKRWFKDRRVGFVFLAMGLYLCYYLVPFTSYGLASHQKCTVWVFPLLFANGTVSLNLAKTVLHVGMLLLLCDAPFLTPLSPYMILRSRRKSWWYGECLYIVIAAGIYTLFLFLVSALIILPVGTFGNDWGGVLRDLVYGTDEAIPLEIAMAYGINMNISSDLYRFIYPQGAQLYTMVAVWCSFSFVGLLMYLVSLSTKKLVWGMCVSGFFIFLDPIIGRLINQFFPQWLEFFSPVVWTSVNILKSTRAIYPISIPMAMTLYAVIIGVLFLLIGIASKKAVIEVIEAAETE